MDVQVYKGYCPVKGTTVAIKMVDLDKYEGKTDLVQNDLQMSRTADVTPSLWLENIQCS